MSKPPAALDALEPEIVYHRVTDPGQRRKLVANVIVKYRGRIAASVRRTVPQQHWKEAEQCGAVGLWLALEKFEPGRLGVSLDGEGDRGEAFWFFASRYVRDEVRRFMEESVFDRERSHKAKGHPEHASVAKHRKMISADAPRPSGSSIADAAVSPDPGADEVLAELEALGLLQLFLDMLEEDERHLLLCPKRKRPEGGIEAVNNARARRHLTLIERARAFVRGQDGEPGRRDSVCGSRDTVRP